MVAHLTHTPLLYALAKFILRLVCTLTRLCRAFQLSVFSPCCPFLHAFLEYFGQVYSALVLHAYFSRESLMQDLKDAAIADAGADSGAGGLEGLYDGGSTSASAGDGGGLPDFFKTGVAPNMVASVAGGGAGGSGNNASGLYDPLAGFSLGEDVDGQDDDGAALLASLGLDSGGAGEGQGQSEGDALQSSAGAGGLGQRGGEGGAGGKDSMSYGRAADQSEWARMQKQFEDMNKSFLQE